MKSFNLTWLLYNKHLYEKLIYMDRKIQHSMSTMIDLLQPSNDDDNDYSPAEYTQLLNRFLAFDEEMSEIACLYKDSQAKIISQPFQICIHNEYQFENKNNLKTKKKKKSKKTKKSPQDNPTTTTTTTTVPPQQGSNGSSIGSGNGGDESSSISSFDDYLLDNDISSTGYTQEEQDELTRFLEDDLKEQLLEGLFDSVSPITTIQHQIYQSRFNHKQTDSTITIDNEKWIQGIIQGIQSESEKITTNKEELSNRNIFIS